DSVPASFGGDRMWRWSWRRRRLLSAKRERDASRVPEIVLPVVAPVPEVLEVGHIIVQPDRPEPDMPVEPDFKATAGGHCEVGLLRAQPGCYRLARNWKNCLVAAGQKENLRRLRRKATDSSTGAVVHSAKKRLNIRCDARRLVY